MGERVQPLIHPLPNFMQIVETRKRYTVNGK
jgi:hypothetical protein